MELETHLKLKIDLLVKKLEQQQELILFLGLTLNLELSVKFMQAVMQMKNLHLILYLHGIK